MFFDGLKWQPVDDCIFKFIQVLFNFPEFLFHTTINFLNSKLNVHQIHLPLATGKSKFQFFKESNYRPEKNYKRNSRNGYIFFFCATDVTLIDSFAHIVFIGVVVPRM